MLSTVTTEARINFFQTFTTQNLIIFPPVVYWSHFNFLSKNLILLLLCLLDQTYLLIFLSPVFFFFFFFFLFFNNPVSVSGASLVAQEWKIACSAGDTGDEGSIPGWERSPGGGHGSPLQYSRQVDAVDRGAWQGTVHGVAKSQTQLKWLSTQAFLSSDIANCFPEPWLQAPDRMLISLPPFPT